MVKSVMKKDSLRDKKMRKKEKRGRNNYKKGLKERRGWRLKEILRESTPFERKEIGQEEVTVTQVRGTFC